MSIWKALLFCFAAIAATCLAADPIQFAGPTSGVVYDAESHALRPVIGVPGAAYLGDELIGSLDFASVAPGGKFALAVRGGALFAVRGLDRGQALLVPIAGAIESVDRISWSGPSAAAVYSTAGHALQMWKSLDAEPEATGTAEVPGTLVALAASASAAAFATGDGGIYSVGGGSSPRLITRAGKPGGIAVSGSDLFFTDRERNEVLRVANFAGANDAVLFANEQRGISDPVAVAAYRGRLFVAGASNRSISVYDASTGELSARLDVDFEPSRLEALSGSLFLLNNGGAEPLQLLEADQAPAIYFVPARRAAE